MLLIQDPFFVNIMSGILPRTHQYSLETGWWCFGDDDSAFTLMKDESNTIIVVFLHPSYPFWKEPSLLDYDRVTSIVRGDGLRWSELRIVEILAMVDEKEESADDHQSGNDE